MGSGEPFNNFVGRTIPLFDVIWGISSDAKDISVFNCCESMSINTSCPFPIARYDIQVVAVGKHIRSLDELGNYDIKAYIQELSYWFRPDCLHFEHEKYRYSYYIDQNQAHSTTVKLDDGCELKLQGETTVSHVKTGMRLEIEQRSTLNFLFSVPISMQNAKHKVFAFEQFLSFATLRPVQCDRFLLIDKDKKTDPSNDPTIEIYYKKDDRIEPPERFWEYLFVFETIKDSFPLIIGKWYTEKDMFPVRAHLIDSIGHKRVFCSADFLVVVQAVEGYYCRFKKDGLGLRSILSKLIDEFSDIFIMEISNSDIDCICDSRHYYSHLLPNGKKKHVVDGMELYNLNHKLRKLLLCCILQCVGFSNEEMNNIFSKSRNTFLRMINGEEKR